MKVSKLLKRLRIGIGRQKSASSMRLGSDLRQARFRLHVSRDCDFYVELQLCSLLSLANLLDGREYTSIMRLADPLSITEGNVPVAIFSLGDRRMFLPISEGYQVSSGLVRGSSRGFMYLFCYLRTCSDGLPKISIWKRMLFSLFEHPQLMPVEEGRL